MSSDHAGEQQPLLAGPTISETAEDDAAKATAQHDRTRATVGTGAVALFIIAVIFVVIFLGDGLSRDPYKAALEVLGKSPVIVSCLAPANLRPYCAHIP
jgi:hypothetical protein